MPHFVRDEFINMKLDSVPITSKKKKIKKR